MASPRTTCNCAMVNPMYEYPRFLVFPAVMAFAGAMDLLTMTIPNRISIALVGAFFLIAFVIGMPANVIMMHVAAGLLILAGGIALFAFGKFGGGDAKLLAAGALWIGLDGLVLYLALVGAFGGLLAIGIILYRKVPVDVYPIPDWAHRLHARSAGIPYGIAIAAGAMFMYPKTPWFQLFLA